MNKQKSLPISLLLLTSGLTLMVYSYIGIFSRLMADDFCSINDARRYKMLRYIWHWYTTWGGRYSAIAMDELIPYIGAIGVRYMPFVVMLVWVIVTSITCHILLQNMVSRTIPATVSVSLGVVIVFATILVSPGVQTVLYWWNATRTYIFALISFTVYISYLYWAAGKLSTRWHIFLGSLFGFLVALFIGGFNETFTSVQVSFFTGLATLYLVTKKSSLKDTTFSLLTAATLGSIIALIIMMRSPGAARRQTFFPPHPDFVKLFEIALTGYIKYLSSIANSMKKISALLGLVFVSIWTGTKSEEKLSAKWLVFLSVTATVFLSFASLLPSAYGLAAMPASRTYIVPTYVLIAGLGFSGLMLGKWLSGSVNAIKPIYLNTGLLLCAVVFIVFSSWINAKYIYDDRGKYISFADQWDQVDAQIKQAKLNGDESITIPAMNGWASLDRPNQNPKFWVTACYSEYYGIQVYGPPYPKPISP